MTVPPREDPADPEPSEGSATTTPATVNGRYLIERELGRGGIGVVYLARDLRLHEMPVVIKFLLEDSTQNAWLSRKFLQEAEALTRIHHPGVVRVIDRDRTPDGQPFFVMEFVKGVALRSAIRPTGLDLEFAAAIVREVGQALNAAHLEGVLHRDLKPENIMLETLSNGAQHAKLIDFGIAKVRDSRDSAPTELGMLAGSLYYMAPEQLLGEPASVASDVYAFATVAYELLTGRRPFNPDAPNQIAAIPQLMSLQRSGQIVPPQQLRPGVSAAAEALVMRGLAFDPAARVADARQFGDELAQALRGAGEPVPSVVTLRPSVPLPGGTTQPSLPVSQPPARRRAPLVAVGAALALGAALSLVYLQSRSSPAVPPALHEMPAAKQSQAEVRTLTYSVTLQRDPKKPPIPLVGETIVSAGDRMRLAFTSQQAGHLYVFNEGPRPAGAARNMNVLFPSPGSAAEFGPGLTVSAGSADGFVFDRERGVERIWIVWSRGAQPFLDAMKRYVNPTDQGEITDAAHVAALDTFLRAHESPKPDVAVDNVKKATTVSARTDVLVSLLEFEHQ